MSLVTVVIPSYNTEQYIGQAVQSVLSQTFKDFELIIIDDASKDQTVQKIQEFNDPRIRLIRNEKNLGAEGNWNKTLEYAKGKYFKLLCGDDLIYPDCLEKEVAVLESPENQNISLVSARRDVIDHRGQTLVKNHGLGSRVGRVSGRVAKLWTLRAGTNLIGEPSIVLFRSELISKVGKWDGSLPYMIDLDYWFKLLDLGDLYALPETLGAFRVSPTAISTVLTKRQATQSRQFFRKHASHGVGQPWDLWMSEVRSKVMARFRQALYFYAKIK